jgi:hypothetical protein
MLDQKQNQGFDLVVSISFDQLQDKGSGRGSNNGRGNNSSSNNVNKGNINRGSIEAMKREQLLLNSFLKKLAFMGYFNINSKYEALIILFSYTLMWTCEILVECNFVAHNYITMWSYG